MADAVRLSESQSTSSCLLCMLGGQQHYLKSLPEHVMTRQQCTHTELCIGYSFPTWLP